MEQVIYSQYRYPKGNATTEEIFKECRNMFDATYDERGVQISGVGAAIDVNANMVILLVYSMDAEVFLKLKFCNCSNVKIWRYY